LDRQSRGGAAFLAGSGLYADDRSTASQGPLSGGGYLLMTLKLLMRQANRRAHQLLENTDLSAVFSVINVNRIKSGMKQVEAGRTAIEVGREMGVSKHTIYAWKAKCGGMNVSEAQRLRQLEEENRRLKQMVADLSLDKEALKSVIAKNGWGS
jgi:putative transposase